MVKMNRIDWIGKFCFFNSPTTLRTSYHRIVYCETLPKKSGCENKKN